MTDTDDAENGEDWADEAWDDDRPREALSLVSHVRGSQDTRQLVGLFVDEHVEMIPNETETTGLSFHYDEPGNRAPQTNVRSPMPAEPERQ